MSFFWMVLELARCVAVRLRLPYRLSVLYVPLLRLLRRPSESWPCWPVYEELASMRILFVGSLERGSTGWSRWKAFQSLALRADAVDVSAVLRPGSVLEQAKAHHLYAGRAVRELNRALLEKARGFRPQMLWVEKGLHVQAQTLSGIREAGCGYLIHFSPDNQKVFANQSRHYLQGLGLYDGHVTTKTENVPWLKACGARSVRVMGKGFDPDLHRPYALSPAEQAKFGCDVGFVGHWEPWRERLLWDLWRKGYAVKVWGGGWRKARFRRHPLFAGAEQLTGEEYGKALCGAKINLCLLSRWFGDKTTARSVEIPACGGFLLAERNPEHQALFREGQEAEFYDSSEEMFRKIDHALRREPERRAIAEAGRRRCVQGYSHAMRIKELFSQPSES